MKGLVTTPEVPSAYGPLDYRLFRSTLIEYNLACTQSGLSLWGMPVSVPGRNTDYVQTERLYFAPTVGMVKSKTLIDGVVAFTKEWSGSDE